MFVDDVASSGICTSGCTDVSMTSPAAATQTSFLLPVQCTMRWLPGNLIRCLLMHGVVLVVHWTVYSRPVLFTSADLCEVGTYREPPPGEAGLKASRSASMGMKASTLSDVRGALCTIRCQPSAEESRSPTSTLQYT